MKRLLLSLTLLWLGALAEPGIAADTVYYYYTNSLHSAAVVTDAHGNVVERTYYAPYGQVLNRSMRDGPGYTGHEEDPATGLVYMQQRYYDPQSGRFFSTDPVQPTDDGENFNRYWYANDNPYRYTDPDGRDTTVSLQYYLIGWAPYQGNFGHQYIIMRDTDTGESVISRGGPSVRNAVGVSAAVSNTTTKDPSGTGNVKLVTQMRPASQSADSVNGIPLGKPVAGSTTTLKEPIAAAKATLGKFNNAVDAAHIDYKPRSTNSNAYANTAYQVLTGKTPPSSSTLPGSDVNIEPMIPSCGTTGVCRDHQ